MMKKNTSLVLRSDTQLSLRKAGNLIGITDKILLGANLAKQNTQNQAVEKREHQKKEEDKPVKPSVLTKNIRKDWPRFIEYVRDRYKWMAGSLQLSSSAKIEGGELIIYYDNPLDFRIFSNEDRLGPLTEFASDFFQESLQIRFKPHKMLS